MKILSILGRILGFAPIKTEEGSYEPSAFSRLLAVENKTSYKKQGFSRVTKSHQKILVLCTEENKMTMANGKKFETGNHPVELLLPLMHMQEAGFSF